MTDLHAWTHLPKAQGGTDPIAGLLPDTSYPTVTPLMGPHTNSQDTKWDTDANLAYDPTWAGTWRAENNLGASPADGDDHYAAARIGPKGATFALNLVLDKDANCGRISFQFASDPETDGTGYLPTLTDGYMFDPPDATYVAVPAYQSGGTPTNSGRIDLYAAAPATGYYPFVCEFRVMGDPGTPFTTNTLASDGNTYVNQFDGGPGMYWVRMFVDGKNASSSGYRVPVRGMWIVRSSSPSSWST